jgi:hypothetical protein
VLHTTENRTAMHSVSCKLVSVRSKLVKRTQRTTQTNKLVYCFYLVSATTDLLLTTEVTSQKQVSSKLVNQLSAALKFLTLHENYLEIGHEQARLLLVCQGVQHLDHRCRNRVLWRLKFPRLLVAVNTQHLPGKKEKNKK